MQSSLRAARTGISRSRLSQVPGNQIGEAIFGVRCRRDRRMGSIRRRCVRQLRRSERPWCLLDELAAMSDGDEAALRQAIAAISESDPIVKLLAQVKLGRMKAGDAGLRAITESWLQTYQRIVEISRLSHAGLVRIDPQPRVDVLIAAGVLDESNEAARSLRRAFDQRLSQVASS